MCSSITIKTVWIQDVHCFILCRTLSHIKMNSNSDGKFWSCAWGWHMEELKCYQISIHNSIVQTIYYPDCPVTTPGIHASIPLCCGLIKIVLPISFWVSSLALGTTCHKISAGSVKNGPVKNGRQSITSDHIWICCLPNMGQYPYGMSYWQQCSTLIVAR